MVTLEVGPVFYFITAVGAVRGGKVSMDNRIGDFRFHIKIVICLLYYILQTKERLRKVITNTLSMYSIHRHQTSKNNIIIK